MNTKDTPTRNFSGRPLIARTDAQTIRELRRMGDLLKHNFDVVRVAVFM
jgi:hypothetical protein